MVLEMAEVEEKGEEAEVMRTRMRMYVRGLRGEEAQEEGEMRIRDRIRGGVPNRVVNAVQRETHGETIEAVHAKDVPAGLNVRIQVQALARKKQSQNQPPKLTSKARYVLTAVLAAVVIANDDQTQILPSTPIPVPVPHQPQTPTTKTKKAKPNPQPDQHDALIPKPVAVGTPVLNIHIKQKQVDTLARAVIGVRIPGWIPVVRSGVMCRVIDRIGLIPGRMLGVGGVRGRFGQRGDEGLSFVGGSVYVLRGCVFIFGLVVFGGKEGAECCGACCSILHEMGRMSRYACQRCGFSGILDPGLQGCYERLQFRIGVCTKQ